MSNEQLLREALQLAEQELTAVLNSINQEAVHFDGDEFHERLRLIRAALAPPASQGQAECREDGRCQYAIDNGAEGLGACPPGKCAMPTRQDEAVALTGCNCRWKGETQVEWCEHHRAHLDAIHEWAQRAKAAESKLKASQEQAQQPQAQPIKDHEIARAVNELRDIARTFHATQQLRERIAGVVLDLVKGKSKPQAQAQELPPLPEPDVSWVDGQDQYGYDTYSHAHSDAQMRDYARAALAAKQERKPCRSPYCECNLGECSHPGFYDARHMPK